MNFKAFMAGPAGFNRSIRIRTKLILAFLPLIALPSMVMGYFYYETSSNLIYDNIQSSVLELARKKNELIDERLLRISESALSINVDTELQAIFRETDKLADYQLLGEDRNATSVLYKYFPPSDDIYSRHIVTEHYMFGANTVFFPRDAFYRSDLFDSAMKTKGRLTFFPTYEFTDMFHTQHLSEIKLDYRYLVSAVQIINPISMENGSSVKLTEGKLPAVLVLNFKQEELYSLFQDNLPIPGISYMVVTPEGQIVSHPDVSRLSKKENFPWLEIANNKKSGTMFIEMDGRKMLVCYTTSSVTGWISVVTVPAESLVGSLSHIQDFTMYAAVFLGLFSVGMAYVVSRRITLPLHNLLVGIKRMGDGKFSNNIPVTSNDEFGHLIAKFNQMDFKIQTLIEENYASKLREKEAQLMALNMQMNPHFLYNTLNTVNWMALETDQKEISKMIMSLCTMLQYTMRNTEEVVSFREDFEWLRCYAHVMSTRFEGKFTFRYDIEESLYNSSVPKLFLQPFLENCILHGFENIEEGGIITLTGVSYEGKSEFALTDNGQGITPERMEEMSGQTGSSIGIRNVDTRLKLLYGAEYGVSIASAPGQGTAVTITLPPLRQTDQQRISTNTKMLE